MKIIRELGCPFPKQNRPRVTRRYLLKWALLLSAVVLLSSATRAEQWTPERAWRWYNRQPLLIGCNYIPANSVSYTEMWMGYAFDPKLIDRELSLAQGVGFNCVRLVLPFVVWEAEPEAFKRRFETFLSISETRGLRVIPCFFDDCAFGPSSDPVFGQQPNVVIGWYANGWTPSPGHKRVRDPKLRPALQHYVKDLLNEYRNDPRILCWDLYNEPGNSGMGEDSLSLLQDVFAWAHDVNPSQPLTSAVWGGNARVGDFQRQHSDIVTFHNYKPALELSDEIQDLKKLGRPLICTEWMKRIPGFSVAACLGVLVDNRVGALSWGLVNGRDQTDLPWGHRPGDPAPKIWQHDLFRADLTPYDPQEIEAFRAAIRHAAEKRP